MLTPSNETELSALIRLLEDPDDAVYQPVSSRILEYGAQALPHLEHIWETSDEAPQQTRVESLMRRINFLDISKKLAAWRQQDRPDLWEALLILDQLHHREDRSETLRSTLEQIRRNAWLELNQYLTPLEQINVLSRVIFDHERFVGVTSKEEKIGHHFIGDILTNRRGNQIGLGLLLQVLSDKLDLPLYTLSIPGIFLLGSPNMFNPRDKNGIESIDFYLDPYSGELFGKSEVEQYLRRIHQPANDSFFRPQSDTELINNWLRQVEQKVRQSDEQHLAAQASELILD